MSFPRSTRVSPIQSYFALEEQGWLTFGIVYGMGVDLASVLGIMGTVWTGDVVSLNPSFSIGGITPLVNNLLDNLGGVLGMAIPPLESNLHEV